MSPAVAKTPLFVFEALGSLACGYYGNYVFFLFRDRHGFGEIGNLGVAALMGFVIAVASWQGGIFAQLRGCFKAIYLGQIGMIMALVGGALLPPLQAQLVVLVVWTASQFIVWPALEALITEGEDRFRRAQLVGIYSVVWAACSALSYFFGGALFECLGGGSIYWLPPGLHLIQMLVLWPYARPTLRFPTAVPSPSPAIAEPPAPSPLGLRRQSFQRLAWLANPFACVAAFTLLAMIPTLARRLGLNTTSAGLFCSVWFFARLAAFIVLGQWHGWHYRFRWLLGGYVALLVGFALVLTAGDLLWLSLGQVGFGWAVGLLYYSSLFYSMDVGQTRAKHGGIHEAAMGAGNFVGPGVGAASLLLAPQSPHAGTWAVGGLLTLGLLGVVGLRLHFGRTGAMSDSSK